MKLDDAALDTLFRTARTRNAWLDRPVSEAQIQEIYGLLKWGPTSANSCPARFVWVRSPEGKRSLAECAAEGNRAKILQAPVTVIIGYDLNFHERLPQLFPARGEQMKANFGDPQLRETTAFRNGTLQGAYLILAARALGLDCGPMSGFDNAAVDQRFFPSPIKSNFICSIGYGSDVSLYPRNPRLSFDEANRFA